MATISIQAQLTTEQLLEALGKLEPSELESVTRKALQLQAQQSAQSRFQREAQLLAIIFQKQPIAFRRRFDRLTAKRRAFQLTPAEHEELLGMVEEVQARDVRYVEALTKLAHLRQTTLPELMQSLAIRAS